MDCKLRLLDYCHWRCHCLRVDSCHVVVLSRSPAGSPALFTSLINQTWEESTAYTSLVSCGKGCAVVFYDLMAGGANVFEKNGSKFAFAMRMRYT